MAATFALPDLHKECSQTKGNAAANEDAIAPIMALRLGIFHFLAASIMNRKEIAAPRAGSFHLIILLFSPHHFPVPDLVKERMPEYVVKKEPLTEVAS